MAERRIDPRPASIMLEGALGDEDRRKMMSWVNPAVVEAFGTLYWEANEFNDEDLRDWLDQQLLVSASRRGWRANQVERIQLGEQEKKQARERYLDPTYGPAEKEAPQEGKRGWG